MRRWSLEGGKPKLAAILQSRVVGLIMGTLWLQPKPAAEESLGETPCGHILEMGICLQLLKKGVRD